MVSAPGVVVVVVVVVGGGGVLPHEHDGGAHWKILKTPLIGINNKLQRTMNEKAAGIN